MQTKKEEIVRALLKSVTIISVLSGILMLGGIALGYSAISSALHGIVGRVLIASLSVALILTGLSLPLKICKAIVVKIVRILREMDAENASRLINELASKTDPRKDFDKL